MSFAQSGGAVKGRGRNWLGQRISGLTMLMLCGRILGIVLKQVGPKFPLRGGAMTYAWEFPTLSQVALYMVLILAAGVANYIATWVIVLGAIFAEIRDWVEKRCVCVQKRCEKRNQTFCTRTTRFVAGKVMYFVKCPLCVGVWVGF